MKRKNLKPMIISALLAVGFGASSVGTSFALFTDRAETKIDVTAGIVDLAVKYENLKAYSLDETDNTKWVQVENGKFATDGTYTLNDQTGVVKLERMVPGDKVEFDIKLLNKSNVKTKYRFAMSKTGKLAPYLEASFGNETKLQWTALEASTNLEDGKLVETAHVVIEFPNNTETSILPREEGYDNGAQGLSATYVLGYEMVQGNAQVTNDSVVEIEVEKSVNPVAPETPTGEYTFDIMSDDGLVGVAGIAEDADPVKLTVTSDNTTAGNFTIEGATTANYDISVDGKKDGTDVTVKLYVGEGYQQVYVFHENETTPIEDVEYNPQTGYVTFVTDSFSQYHFAGVKEAYEASVEGTFYKTLSAAFNASGSKMITLLSDVNSAALTVETPKNFDLNGHTLTISSGNPAITVEGLSDYNGQLTMKNGTLNMPGYSSYGLNSAGNVTLKDMKINSSRSTVIYNDGKAWNTPGSMTLDNVEVNATNSSGTAVNAHAVKDYFGTILSPKTYIKNSKIVSAHDAVMINATDVEISNTNITAEENAAWIIFSATGGSATGVMKISGNVNINAHDDLKRLNAQSGNRIEISAGKYNFNPTSYVDTEQFTVTDNEDGTWTVAEI